MVKLDSPKKTLTKSRFQLALECPTKLYYYGKKNEYANQKDDSDIYGEVTHTYQPENGNLQMSEMMTGILNKLDGLTNVNPNIVKKNRAVEVDIKRAIAIGDVDINGVKSEEYKGKVNNKLDKLKALRRRNGSK